MANGYGSSSDGTPITRVSTQGVTAPPGYHFMPDGTLMSDAEHVRLHGGIAKKIIRDFIIDLSHLNFSGENRQFSVLGDEDAVFSLEIKNEDDYYYNFSTDSFQAAQARLKNQSIRGGVYNGNIKFPSVTDADDYDIYLFAEAAYNTEHSNYNEIRFKDNSVDINSSKGSDSTLLKKIIRQYDKTVVSLSALSPNGLTDFTGISVTGDTTRVTRGRASSVYDFSITATAAATRGLSVLATPNENTLTAFVSRTIASAKLIDGEDKYAVLRGESTTNGDFSGGATKIVLDAEVASVMAVGDRVTGTGIPSSSVITVVALDPDDDNDKEFSVSASIEVDDGVTLSFYKEVYRRWGINNTVGLGAGLFANATNVTGGSYLAPYTESVTITTTSGYDEDTLLETTTDIRNITVDIPAVDNSGYTPTLTDGVITSSGGYVTFNQPQIAALASDIVKFYGHGNLAINSIYGTSVELSDVKVVLTDLTTTTTSAVSNSVTIPVASVNGILPYRCTMSGIGVDAGAVDPTVTARSATSGAGNLTVSVAQTLESGQTFTFNGCGLVATITGKIKVLEVGSSDFYLYFDLEKFLQGG